jgi:hypothetical protein
MRPGTTVVEWMQDHDVRSIGIDVRRFASFGVIKVPPIQFTRAPMYLTFVWQGFLHRARRWPILQADDAQHTETKTTTLPPSPIGPRKRATSLTVPPLASSFSVRAKRRTSDEMLAFATVSVHSTSVTVSLPPRAAEASLGTFRSRGSGPPSSPQTVRARHAAATPASLFEITQTLAAPVPVRPRLSRSPSSPAIKTQTSGTAAPAPVLASHPLAYPPALVPLLDGEHQADELCCQFEVGWPTFGRLVGCCRRRIERWRLWQGVDHLSVA